MIIKKRQDIMEKLIQRKEATDRKREERNNGREKRKRKERVTRNEERKRGRRRQK